MEPHRPAGAELITLCAVCKVSTTGTQGLGGIGKTQMVIEFAYRHLENYDVVW